MSSEPLQEPAAGTDDLRPWFVSVCFVQLTLSASLFIFLVMENQVAASFLSLDTELLTYSRLSATVLAFMFLFTIAAVVSVWIRNRKILVSSVAMSSVLLVLFVLVVVWVGLLSGGRWDDSFRDEFMRRTTDGNRTIDPDKCCGWHGPCDHNDRETCKKMIDTEVSDFSVRVIPLVGCIIACGIATMLIVCVSPNFHVSAAGGGGVHHETYDSTT